MDLNMANHCVKNSSLYIDDLKDENLRLLLIRCEKKQHSEFHMRRFIIYRENNFKYSSRVLPGPMPVWDSLILPDCRKIASVDMHFFFFFVGVAVNKHEAVIRIVFLSIYFKFDGWRWTTLFSFQFYFFNWLTMKMVFHWRIRPLVFFFFSLVWSINVARREKCQSNEWIWH